MILLYWLYLFHCCIAPGWAGSCICHWTKASRRQEAVLYYNLTYRSAYGNISAPPGKPGSVTPGMEGQVRAKESLSMYVSWITHHQDLTYTGCAVFSQLSSISAGPLITSPLLPCLISLSPLAVREVIIGSCLLYKCGRVLYWGRGNAVCSFPFSVCRWFWEYTLAPNKLPRTTQGINLSNQSYLALMLLISRLTWRHCVPLKASSTSTLPALCRCLFLIRYAFLNRQIFLAYTESDSCFWAW